MTINYNRKLLAILFLVLIILLFITGIPRRLFKKLTASEEYDTIHLKYENMYQNLSMKNIYKERQINLNKKISKLNVETEIMQDKIIIELSNVSKRNKIELGNIKFSEIMPVFDEEENKAVCIKATVDFDGYFDDMISFIDDIKNSKTEISVTNISILMLETDKVHVMLNLTFYALPR